jgi:hypothetical protein
MHQVLQQLADVGPSMTYSQARAAAASKLNKQAEAAHAALLRQLDWHKHSPTRLPQQQDAPGRDAQCSISSSSSSGVLGSRRWPEQTEHNVPARDISNAGWSGAQKHPDFDAAAAGTLSEMKQWTIDQELSMMEVC